MEPVEIDIRLKQNVATEGKKVTQSIEAIAAATEKAKAMIDRHQAGIVELKKDLVELGIAYKKATTKEGKSEILTEIELTKKNIIDETQAIKVLKAEIASMKKMPKTAEMPDANQIAKTAMGYNSLNMSVQQVVRELPAASMGLNMFFLAIGNNIPIMTDNIKRARLENEALKASGASTVPVWKQVLSAFTSWQSAMMIGITLITMYGKDIANWAKEVLTGEKAIKRLTAAQMGLTSANQIMIESLKNGSEFQKAVQSVEQLSTALKNAKGSHELEKKAVDDYNSSLGVTFGKVNDVDSALKLINKNKDAYIEAMKAMSFANAFFAKSAEDAYKSMEVGLKSQQQILRDAGVDGVDMWEKYSKFKTGFDTAGIKESKYGKGRGSAEIDGVIYTYTELSKIVSRLGKEITTIEGEERARQIGMISKHQNKSLELAKTYYKEYTDIFKANDFVVDDEKTPKDKKTGSMSSVEANISNKLLGIRKDISDKYKKEREDFMKNNQKVVKMGGEKELQELQRIRNEADRIIMQSGSERERIEKEYADKILTLRKDGRFAEIELLEDERTQKLSNLQSQLIKETDLYKLASDDRLRLTKELNKKLIEEAKAKIEADQSLTPDDKKKLIAGIDDAGADRANNAIDGLITQFARLKKAKEDAANAKSVGDTTGEAKAAIAVGEATTAIEKYGNEVLNYFDQASSGILGIMDQLGMFTEEEKESANQIVGMVSGAGDLAVGIATGNVSQIMSGGISLVSNAIEFFDKKSKDIAKKQKALEKDIDSLTAAYSRLQRAVDNALGTDVYDAQKSQIANLRDQIAANNAWIEQEQQKKKKKQDAEAIAARKAEIEALNNEIDDVKTSIAQDLAQTTAKELAQQVGDALVQAATDGTDAFVAMGDVVNDVLKNAVTNALEKQFLEKQMGKATDYLSSAMEDGKLTDAERKQFSEMVTAAGNNYNEALAAYKDILGSSDTAREGAKKGIATASQDSIDELKGGVYALRMGVADIRNNAREQTLVIRTITNQLDTLIDNTEPIAEMAEDIKNLSADINDIKTRGINVKV
ncbi:MAG: hypothetical protein EOM47_09045 [Bacteroidia bacterium]|nr:hypothetical protein [Bacteroidia bacterium]